ncbi:hypothetical protein J5N97_026100, partial [Dioscorea zingiberensis]
IDLQYHVFHVNNSILVHPVGVISVGPVPDVMRRHPHQVPSEHRRGLRQSLLPQHAGRGPNSTELRLRTPSGTYPVKSINYADPHMVIYDPSMWSCHADGTPAPPLHRHQRLASRSRPRTSTSSSTAGKSR